MQVDVIPQTSEGLTGLVEYTSLLPLHGQSRLLGPLETTILTAEARLFLP